MCASIDHRLGEGGAGDGGAGGDAGGGGVKAFGARGQGEQAGFLAGLDDDLSQAVEDAALPVRLNGFIFNVQGNALVQAARSFAVSDGDSDRIFPPSWRNGRTWKEGEAVQSWDSPACRPLT